MKSRIAPAALVLVAIGVVASVQQGRQKHDDRKSDKGLAIRQAAVAGSAVENPESAAPVVDEHRWPAETAVTVQVVFGVSDVEPTSWKGSLQATGNTVLRVRGWRLGSDMSVDSGKASWTCGTWWGPEPRQRPFDGHLPNRLRPFIRPGLLIDLEHARGTLRFSTEQGDWELDVSRLAAEGKTMHLGERVLAQWAVFGRPLAAGHELKFGNADGRWYDFPSIAVSASREEEIAVAYQGYSNQEAGDGVFVRRRVEGEWLAAEKLTSLAGDHYRTAVAYDRDDRLWVVYGLQRHGNWDLFGRLRTGGEWGSTVRLTEAAEPDIHHCLVRDAGGDVWLVWQGFRDGQSDILARRWDGSDWGKVIVVSQSAVNDWEPAVAACPDRGIAVVWDGYDQGDYDIFCRVVGRDEPDRGGSILQVTGEASLEARPTVACDRHGRLWIAYDVAGPHWGKDTGFWLEIESLSQGTKLYQGRRIGLRLVELKSGRILDAPAAVPSFPLNQTAAEHIEYPQLVTDRDGRVWLFCRRYSVLDLSRRNIGRRFQWDLLASYFDEQLGRWSEPHLVSDSDGRLDMRSALASGSEQIWAAWSCDHRPFGGTDRPDVCSVFAGRIGRDVLRPVRGAGPLETKPAGPYPVKPADPVHPTEREDVARIRAYQIESGDVTYRIYRGDMHRHTENSPDGGGDGSLLDAYRYALDAASMDYLLITDHNDGGREYDWWLREKSNDLFHIGESFVGLYGYERSVSYPNGHRNIFFTKRGVRPLDIHPRENARGDNLLNSGDILYPYLGLNQGICFSHTSATGMGTDWRDGSPILEPLVEIFQGDRTNYERLQAPWAAREDDVATQEGGFRPLGFVNRALQNGRKLGFQASSDHLSTHLSYSCVLARANTREALMDAMRRHHTYAATDNIVLDVRAEGVDGPKLMGDIFQTTGRPQLKVRVIGTGKLREVVVIKNDRVVYSTAAGGNKVDFTFADMDSTPGESYYYVRVLQENKRLAWSSPMWVIPLAQ